MQDVVHILADRFAVTNDGYAIDLATGAPVVLKIGAGGGASEQSRWSLRCEALHKLHHRALAPLVDYGAVGESQRFEAWGCGRRWSGGHDAAQSALRMTSRFFHASGMANGSPSIADVNESTGRAVVVPGDEAAYSTDSTVPATVQDLVSLDDCGIATIDRRADAVLADLFASLTGSRPHIISLWGPPGSGRTTAVLRAARIARLNGFVPVGVSVVNRIHRSLLEGRSLCLINEEGRHTQWSTLLTVAVRTPRAHVLLSTGCEEIEPEHGVRLEPIPCDALAGAVRPERLDGRLAVKVGRAASLANGLPGRFAELLWRSCTCRASKTRRRDSRMVSQVAEQRAEYGGHENTDVDRHRNEQRAWPTPGELAALRRRSEAAVELLRQGQHAPGIRQLRQAIGSLVRRGDWTHATAGALALASGLLVRGQAREAQAVLGEARDYADRAGSEPVLIDVAVQSGHVWIDLAQLDRAESVIGTALAAARRTADTLRVACAALALGRCLFWKGDYKESASVLAPLVDGAARSGFDVRARAAAARAAIGLGDVGRAMSLAREAVEGASSTGDRTVIALASCAAAFVHLAVNDLDAVAVDVHASTSAARAAHEPMRAIRARVMLAECERRRGRPTTAAALVKRIRRVGPGHLPAIIGARVDLLHALLQSSASSADIAKRHASHTGLAALSLYVDPQQHSVADSSTEELVGLLHVCQTAEEETTVLGDVCSRIRRQLHAAAVAVFVHEGALYSPVATDGGRVDAGIAQRAITAGITVAPHRAEDRLEAAAPVRYGGAVLGALVARWPIGTPYDLSRASAVLTTAATAAAPVVSAALARRSRPAAAATEDLIGVTAAMSELRRAIEWAAAAPFAVLIEGESGSGKELVARAVHRSGVRRDRPFCTLNCAALPDELIEAELFGHARGAFTGAVTERAGVFEEAHGGTLFLDEVGELSPRAQAKLLRVIQEGELRRIGENLSRRVDVRIVCATNRDLRQEVAAGRFRLDLLYRLDVIRIAVPPLRARREDIAALADHFWREATARIGSRAVLGATTSAALARYDWPGNVRELQNVLAALAVRTPRRGVVAPTALPPQFGEPRRAEACRLDDARRTFEERFVRAALVRSGGHRARAAAELGVTRQGLTKLMTRLGINDRRSAATND